MLQNSRGTSLSDSHSRVGMDTIRCNDWSEFLDLTGGLAKSQPPFQSFKWSTSDNESETSSVATQETFNCSTWTTERVDDQKFMVRQRLHMNKLSQLISFLEGIDTDWEVTPEYECQDYVEEERDRICGQDDVHGSEAFDGGDVDSDMAMVPTDMEDAHVLQAKKDVDSMFTRCCRTMAYVQTMEPEEWEKHTPTELNSNESPLTVRLESKSDDDMFHVASSSCDEVVVRSSNSVRSVENEISRISENDEDFVIPSSSIEEENEDPTVNQDELPGRCNEFESISSANDIRIPLLDSSISGCECSKPDERFVESDNHVEGSAEAPCQLTVLDCTVVPNTIAEVVIPSEELRRTASDSVCDQNNSTMTQDCGVQVSREAFNGAKKNSPTKVVLPSPDDPLGFQHLTWQESSSASEIVTPVEPVHPSAVGTATTVSEFALQGNLQPIAPAPPQETPMAVIEDESFEGLTLDCTVMPKTIADEVTSRQELKCPVSASVCIQNTGKQDCGIQVAHKDFDNPRKVSVTDPNSQSSRDTVITATGRPVRHVPSSYEVTDSQLEKNLINLQPISESMRYSRPVKQKSASPTPPAPAKKKSQALMKDERFRATTLDSPEAPETKAENSIARPKTQCTGSPDGGVHGSLIGATMVSDADPSSSPVIELVSSPEDPPAGRQRRPCQEPATPVNQPVKKSNAVATTARKSALKWPAKGGSRFLRPLKRKLSAAVRPTPPKKVQFNLTPLAKAGGEKFKGSNPFAYRTNQRKNQTPGPARAQYDPYDVSNIDDDGDVTFENLFTRQSSRMEAATNPKNMKNYRKKHPSPEPELSPPSETSSDSTNLQILSILQETKKSFSEAASANWKKIEKPNTSEVVHMSEERLTEVIKTVVTDVMKSEVMTVKTAVADAIKSTLKSRVRRPFRRSVPPRKILLKKIFVPKRKACEDKAVQVSMAEERSTAHTDNNDEKEARNTSQSVFNVGKKRDQRKNKTTMDDQRETNKKDIEKPKRQYKRKPKKDTAEETAAVNTSQKNPLDVKEIVEKTKRSTKRTAKKKDPVNFNSSTDNNGQVTADEDPNNDDKNRYKQTTMSQYLQNAKETPAKQKKQELQCVLLQFKKGSSKPKSTKGCYRAPQQFNTEPSEEESDSSSSTLKPNTIYCPNATIFLASNEQEHSFFRHIDELRLSSLQADSCSPSQVIPSSQPPDNEYLQLGRRQRKLKPTALSFSSENEDLPDLDRSPDYDDMYEPRVGLFNNSDYFPEDNVGYVAKRIWEDYRNGRLKTLAELYGTEAYGVRTPDMACEESSDSGLNMTGASRGENRNDSKESCDVGGSDQLDDEDNVTLTNGPKGRAFCSSVRGSQEPYRFSPGFSPIRYD